MKILFKKDGLTGDQLEAVEKLEKSISLEGDLSDAQIKAIVTQQIKESGFDKETLEAITKDVNPDNPESVQALIKNISKRVDDFIAESKRDPIKPERKSFNDNLWVLVEDNLDKIKSHKSGMATLGTMKSVGDMSISANFPGGSTFTQDVRGNLIESPINRIWLRDILPNGVTDGSSVTFPKENGGEGGAAVWLNSSSDKAQTDFDFTSVTNFVHWIAGYVIIEREMLDDIGFLRSWLNARMLLSLKTAENDFILNGVTDGSNPSRSIAGLLGSATAYTPTSGIVSTPVNRILDAAWGQIPTDTEDMYNPTHAILHPRDSVRLGLNMSSGSGEYNLPAGSVGFVNGKLNIGGVDIARTTKQSQDNFLVLDRNAAMFITRMEPELRVFEDATLAKRNKLMLRVEQRATLAVFNDKALVKGTFTATT